MEELQAQMNKRRVEAEEAFRRNQAMLREQKDKGKELAEAAGVSEEDAARRAAYLKEQRDKILAKKRAEREAKMKEFEEEREREMKKLHESMPDSLASQVDSAPGSESKSEADVLAEKRRNMMRIALAQRMKQDLIENEEERLAKMQAEQYSELDRQLRLVEQLRDENRRKEEELQHAIRAQQERRFHNLKKSLA